MQSTNRIDGDNNADTKSSAMGTFKKKKEMHHTAVPTNMTAN